MQLYYFNSDLGCGLRAAKSLEEAIRDITMEVGQMQNPRIRLATEDDILWIKSVDGFIPEIKETT